MLIAFANCYWKVIIGIHRFPNPFPILDDSSGSDPPFNIPWCLHRSSRDRWKLYMSYAELIQWNPTINRALVRYIFQSNFSREEFCITLAFLELVHDWITEQISLLFNHVLVKLSSGSFSQNQFHLWMDTLFFARQFWHFCAIFTV